MSFTDPIDATGYDFENWIRFAFDHPVSDTPWYYTEEIDFTCDPQTVIGYYTRLFHHPRPLLSQYDEARLEQGLWFVVGSQLSEWLWDADIPQNLRVECIEAMPVMFREFLTDHPLDTACFMWWDMLRYFGESPDPAIVSTMSLALDEVLRLPARHCQLSALHGLGHLKHESKEGVIRSYLAASLNIDDELRKYAEHAIAGTVL
jgi:hypothetical protein